MSSKDTKEGTSYADRFESCLAKKRSVIVVYCSDTVFKKSKPLKNGVKKNFGFY